MKKTKSAPRKLLSKIKSPAALKKLAKGAKVVFTNGCFDIVHKGHVTYLERARKLGDILIVALNSDDSVRMLNKGPGRPINPLADRLEVIAALEAVDYVTWFEEATPLEVILKIRPKILAKGGDWTVDTIVGGREVQSWGGKVVSLPYVKGRSTTQILRRAKTGLST